jgi:hypothetical protein
VKQILKNRAVREIVLVEKYYLCHQKIDFKVVREIDIESHKIYKVLFRLNEKMFAFLGEGQKS